MVFTSVHYPCESSVRAEDGTSLIHIWNSRAVMGEKRTF